MRHHAWICAGGALLVLVAACGGSNAASQLARPPDFNPKGQTKCGVLKSQAEPLIVEWPSAERGKLEALASKGVVAVRFVGCEMEVLGECRAPGKYGYTAITQKRDHVGMRRCRRAVREHPARSRQAREQAGDGRGAQRRHDRSSAGTTPIDAGVRPDELVGDCGRATHLVAAMTVGAFQFYAGSKADVSARRERRRGRGRGASSARNETLASDGNQAPCARSSTGDAAPPSGCGALLV